MSKIRQASPNSSWDISYTDKHEEIYEIVCENIESISEGYEEDDMAVVGPYGSGKTQLLFEAFNQSWEQGIPALYTDARTIFNEFEESSQTSIKKWLESRIDDQLDTLRDVNDADWLPAYQSTTERREVIADYSEDINYSSDNTCVLLIDEVEQSYTKLDSQIETDDDNPFRVILDQVTGVYQIWSFGLVSAYEILGEADVRRFEEVRIPVLDVNHVYEVLEDSGMPESLANGIWWLSRGRVGWARKLIDEGPENKSEISEWIRDEVTDYEFDGVRVLDSDVVTSRLSSSGFDAGRASLVFQEGYDPWKVTSSRALSVKDASDILIDIIREDSSSGTVRILERNIEKLIRAFSPPDNWDHDSNTLYIPPTIFIQPDRVEAFTELLEDFILSYEPRGDERDHAIDLLQNVDKDHFQEVWADESGKEATDENEAWSIDPEIIDEAYPPVAVNPDHLTGEKNKTIRQNQTEPISIDTGITEPGINLEIRLCPTNKAFDAAVSEAEKNKDVTTIYALICPGQSDINWETDGWGSTLENYGMIGVDKKGGERLWNFILQFRHYVEYNTSYDIEFDRQTVERIMAEESDRETTNTIDALYDQVERLSENAGSDLVEEYRDRYSLRDMDKPVWEIDILEGDTPFWGYTGTASIPRIGLSFALAFTEVSDGSSINRPDIVESLTQGHDNEYITKSKFPYKEFLDKFFTEDGLRKKVREARAKFGSSRGTLDRALRQLGGLLLSLSEHHSDDTYDLVDNLVNMSSKEGDIEVIRDSKTTKFQAPALFWGLLLYQVVQEEVDSAQKLDSLQTDCQRLEGRIEGARSDIENINELLEPPEDVGEPVQVSTKEVDSYLQNMSTLIEGLESLQTEVSENSSLQVVGLCYWIIIETYQTELAESIGNIEEGVTDPEVVYQIEDLKSEFIRVREEIPSNESVISRLEMSQSDVENELKEFGDEIFNFYRLAGADTIDPTNKDTLNDIRRHSESKLDEIDELINEFESVQSLINTKQNHRENVLSELGELFDLVIEEGQQWN